MTLHTKSSATVADIMTRDPISIEASASARELAQVLADNSISGVPVVDVQDRVIGVVSKTDLLQWCVSGGLGLSSTDLLQSIARDRDDDGVIPADLGIVEDFMTSEPVLATPDEPVKSVAHRMTEENVHRIIVVDEDGCLVGIVTSLDLVRALAT